MPKRQNYSAKSCAKCTNKRQTTQQAILNRKYTLFVSLSRLARSNAFEINNALNTLKGARLRVNLTGEARKSFYRCGSLTHHHRDCRFFNAVCYGCDPKGHKQAVCRSSGKPVRKGKMAQHMVEQRTKNIRSKTYYKQQKLLVLSYVYSKQPIFGLTQEWFRELSFSRLECGVHDKVHIYPLCGIFYFPWHKHQLEGINGFLVSHPKDTEIHNL